MVRVAVALLPLQSVAVYVTTHLPTGIFERWVLVGRPELVTVAAHSLSVLVIPVSVYDEPASTETNVGLTVIVGLIVSMVLMFLFTLATRPEASRAVYVTRYEPGIVITWTNDQH